MLKKFVLSLVALVVALGIYTQTPANAQDTNIAIVNVPQVVNASAKVKALSKDRQAKAEELVKYIESAKKDLASITDANKKKTAEEKYNKEFKAKKDKIDSDYSAKLKEIDTSITKQIGDYATSNGYSMVITKDIVLFGGTDITQDLIKIIK